LSLDALTKLRAEGEDEYEIERIVGSLGSLLRGIDNRHEPIRPLHASFVDFLSNPSRSNDFHVPVRSGDAVLVRSSLRTMSELLHFNMCDLESSYVRNQEITDLSIRVRKNIPEHLSYACQYFAEHLGHHGSDSDILAMVRGFMNKRLLFWLEVMSLQKVISQSLTALLTLQAWIEVSHIVNDKNNKLIKSCRKPI
jgi:hypothetical protein